MDKRILLEALITEREGMLAENTFRLSLGQGMAYTFDSFYDLAQQIRKLMDTNEPKKSETDEKVDISIWIDEARGLAAQCWCDPETEDRIMDAALCEAVARRIATWMETAAQNQRNTDYYRGLLVKCGEAISDKAYIADDGSRSEDVLCAKIPELVDAAFCNGSD